MNYLPVTFGKHKGKTLPQIIFSDPDYFFWAIDNKVFQGQLAVESLELHLKSTQIRIPQSANGEDKVAYYSLHGTERKTFGRINLIPRLLPEQSYQCGMNVRDVIDMRVPRMLAKYDKSGYKIFLAQMKAILFGKSGFYMTKQRCEEFFDNDANFDLGGMDIDGMLIWAAEKMGVPDARAVHA